MVEAQEQKKLERLRIKKFILKRKKGKKKKGKTQEDEIEDETELSLFIKNNLGRNLMGGVNNFQLSTI